MRSSAILGSGIEAAAIEYLDRGAVAAAGSSFPAACPPAPGSWSSPRPTARAEEAKRRGRRARGRARRGGARRRAPRASLPTRRRSGAGARASPSRSRPCGAGRSREDVVVPLDRLAESVDGTVAIGRRHELEAVSWGHAGDGNVHSNFLVAATTRRSWGGSNARSRSSSTSRSRSAARSPASTGSAG